MGQYYKIVNLDKKEYFQADWVKLMETAWIKNQFIGGSLVGLLLDNKSLSIIPKSYISSENKFPFGAWSGDSVILAGDYANHLEFIDSNVIPKYIKLIKNLPLDWQAIKYFAKSISYNDAISNLKLFSNGDTRLLSHLSYEIKLELRVWLKTINIYDLCIIGLIKEIEDSILLKKSITTGKIFLINHSKHLFISLKNYLNQPGIDDDGYIIHPLPLLLCQSNGLGGGDYYGCNSEIAGSWCGDKISTSYFHPEKYNEILPFFSEKYKSNQILFEDKLNNAA